MTILLQLSGVYCTHGGKQIFEDLSFEIKQGDRLAVIGPNGAGKSTLFRLMAKEMPPDRGAVTWKRGLQIGYLHQEPVVDPAMTVLDTVALAAGDPAALERRMAVLETRMAEPFDHEALTAVMDEYGLLLERLESSRDARQTLEGAEILAGLRFPPRHWNEPLGALSGGEGKIVALAGLLASQPDLLLLDEPDNHLDLEAKRWLEQILAKHDGAAATITHDRYYMDRVANSIFELEDGRLQTWPGNYSAFVAQKRAHLERSAELRKVQAREFRKLKASAEQLTQWARQNPKFATRAENQRRKMAEGRERLEATQAPGLDRRTAEFNFDTERAGSLVVEARGLAKSFGNRVIVAPFDLEIRNGERIALVGPNGSGKTTIVRLLLSQEAVSAGTVRMGPSVVPGYYAQKQETLPVKLTAIDFVRKQNAMSEQQAISFLGSLLIDRETGLTTIGKLSGGEQARLQIGGLILAGANFLLLDEPTNNLDIPAVEALEAALDAFDGTLLVISHDRYFLEQVCTRTLEIAGGIVRNYPGDYAWYEEHRDSGMSLQATAASRRG